MTSLNSQPDVFDSHETCVEFVEHKDYNFFFDKEGSLQINFLPDIKILEELIKDRHLLKDNKAAVDYIGRLSILHVKLAHFVKHLEKFVKEFEISTRIMLNQKEEDQVCPFIENAFNILFQTHQEFANLNYKACVLDRYQIQNELLDLQREKEIEERKKQQLFNAMIVDQRETTLIESIDFKNSYIKKLEEKVKTLNVKVKTLEESEKDLKRGKDKEISELKLNFKRENKKQRKLFEKQLRETHESIKLSLPEVKRESRSKTQPGINLSSRWLSTPPIRNDRDHYIYDDGFEDLQMIIDYIHLNRTST